VVVTGAGVTFTAPVVMARVPGVTLAVVSNGTIASPWLIVRTLGVTVTVTGAGTTI
jgi:hypothetical protein